MDEKQCKSWSAGHIRNICMFRSRSGIYGPRREKTCLLGFCQREFQTSLLSYRDNLENWNFTCSKLTYDAFQKTNNKGADQTARMCRLVCACVVRNPRRQVFLHRGPYYILFAKEVISLWKAMCTYLIEMGIIWPQRKKTCLWGFQTTKTQTRLHIWAGWSVPLLFVIWKYHIWTWFI